MHRFVQVNRQKTAVKKKITTYFLKKLLLLVQFFKKFLQFANFFTAWCLDVRF